MDILSERESIRKYLWDRYERYIYTRRPDVTEFRKTGKGVFYIQLAASHNERLTGYSVQTRRVWAVHYLPPFLQVDGTFIDDELNATALMSDIEINLSGKKYIQGYVANHQFPSPTWHPFVQAPANLGSLTPNVDYSIIAQGVMDDSDGTEFRTVGSKPRSVTTTTRANAALLQLATLNSKKVRVYAKIAANESDSYTLQEELDVNGNAYIQYTFDELTTTGEALADNYLRFNPMTVTDADTLVMVKPVSNRIYIDDINLTQVESDYTTELFQGSSQRSFSTQFLHHICMINTKTNLSSNLNELEDGVWLMWNVRAQLTQITPEG